MDLLATELFSLLTEWDHKVSSDEAFPIKGFQNLDTYSEITDICPKHEYTSDEYTEQADPTDVLLNCSIERDPFFGSKTDKTSGSEKCNIKSEDCSNSNECYSAVCETDDISNISEKDTITSKYCAVVLTHVNWGEYNMTSESENNKTSFDGDKSDNGNVISKHAMVSKEVRITSEKTDIISKPCPNFNENTMSENEINKTANGKITNEKSKNKIRAAIRKQVGTTNKNANTKSKHCVNFNNSSSNISNFVEDSNSNVVCDEKINSLGGRTLYVKLTRINCEQYSLRKRQSVEVECVKPKRACLKLKPVDTNANVLRIEDDGKAVNKTKVSVSNKINLGKVESRYPFRKAREVTTSARVHSIKEATLKTVNIASVSNGVVRLTRKHVIQNNEIENKADKVQQSKNAQFKENTCGDFKTTKTSLQKSDVEILNNPTNVTKSIDKSQSNMKKCKKVSGLEGRNTNTNSQASKTKPEQIKWSGFAPNSLEDTTQSYTQTSNPRQEHELLLKHIKQKEKSSADLATAIISLGKSINDSPVKIERSNSETRVSNFLDVSQDKILGLDNGLTNANTVNPMLEMSQVKQEYQLDSEHVKNEETAIASVSQNGEGFVVDSPVLVRTDNSSSTQLADCMKTDMDKPSSNDQGISKVCYKCGLVLKDVTSDLKKVHAEEAVECSQCSFVTKNQEYLVKHCKGQQDLLQEKICEICGYKTKQSTLMQRHLLYHRSDDGLADVLSCVHCSYQTIRPVNLSRHVRKHQEAVRTFKCPSCPFQTRWQNSLYMHVKGKHLHKDERKRYECKQCNFSTRWPSHLYKHNKDKHSGNKTERKIYRCAECEFTAKFQSYLYRHVKEKHRLKGTVIKYSCEECEFETRWQSHYYKHRKDKHMYGVKPAVTNGSA